MVASPFLLKDIGRRKNKYNPTIFEVEGGCHLLSSWVIDVWLTVKHINENIVTWEVAIYWYQMKVGYNKKDSCFNLE